MKPPYSEETINDLLRNHYSQCDQCNYDKDCRLCAGGFGTAEDELVGTEIITAHSCNCPWGNGIDAKLMFLERTFKMQGAINKIGPALNEVRNNLNMLSVYTSWFEYKN